MHSTAKQNQCTECANLFFEDDEIAGDSANELILFQWEQSVVLSYKELKLNSNLIQIQCSNSNLLISDKFWVLKIIMGAKAETYTFSQVKELLQMHENMLFNVFNNNTDRMNKKIDILKKKDSKIMKQLTDLRESVQYHSDNVEKE